MQVETLWRRHARLGLLLYRTRITWRSIANPPGVPFSGACLPRLNAHVCSYVRPHMPLGQFVRCPNLPSRWYLHRTHFPDPTGVPLFV
jgi:hypothetical protein